MGYIDIASLFQTILTSEFGTACTLLDFEPVAGGCINRAGRVRTNMGSYFIKWNTGQPAAVFNAEVKGLQLLRETEIFHIPQQYATGQTDQVRYLVLEAIPSGAKSHDFWEVFGSKLARMHKISTGRFGLDHPNFIGSLPQKNNWDSNWINFFIENRLEPQLSLAAKNGLISDALTSQFEALYKALTNLLPKPSESSLLHGDLWIGNVLTNPDGEVCLIDPAVYYGVNEMELAFTRLFGGFDQRFYDQYFFDMPVAPGFNDRADIYNLYPLLVHLNLFGVGYVPQIKAILKRFVY